MTPCAALTSSFRTFPEVLWQRLSDTPGMVENHNVVDMKALRYWRALPQNKPVIKFIVFNDVHVLLTKKQHSASGLLTQPHLLNTSSLVLSSFGYLGGDRGYRRLCLQDLAFPRHPVFWEPRGLVSHFKSGWCVLSISDQPLGFCQLFKHLQSPGEDAGFSFICWTPKGFWCNIFIQYVDI